MAPCRNKQLLSNAPKGLGYSQTLYLDPSILQKKWQPKRDSEPPDPLAPLRVGGFRYGSLVRNAARQQNSRRLLEIFQHGNSPLEASLSLVDTFLTFVTCKTFQNPFAAPFRRHGRNVVYVPQAPASKNLSSKDRLSSMDPLSSKVHGAHHPSKICQLSSES